MPLPRLLQLGEIATFLARHPATAARVAITRTGMALGIYDLNVYDTVAEWGTIKIAFPGVIEPRGIQVMDWEFGLVTIQPTPTGLYFSGWSAAMGDAEKPDYVAPPHKENTLDDLKHLALMAGGIAALVYIGGQHIRGRAAR